MDVQMNATVEVMYAATGLEWNGRTGQDRTGQETIRQKRRLRRLIAWPQLDISRSVFCSQTYHLTPY